MNVSGVYEIRHVLSGRQYIGSAVNFRRRKTLHLVQLRAGNHHNRYLQNAWAKYGEDAFSFSLLVQCEKDLVLFYEQLLIDGLRPQFNVAQTAGSAIGVKHTNEVRKANSERARRRRAKYDWKGEKRSLVEIAEDLGWDAKVLHNRVLTQKKSLEEAVALGPEVREMRATYMHNGRSLTREEWAKELGIHPRRMHYWIAQGLSIAECLVRLDKNDKRMTFPEMCRQFGISAKTVKSRREKGESLHEALTRPPIQRDNTWRKAKWPISVNGKTGAY
jgi:group I intron endonuclease